MPFKPSKLLLPTSMDDAAEVLSENAGHAVIIAGGTTIYGIKYSGLLDHVDTVIDLSKLGLDYLKEEDGIAIGAYTTFIDIARSSLIRSHREFMAIVDAIRAVPSRQLRNMATIGGSVASSLPYYDLPVALTALDARIRIYGRSGRKEVPILEFLEAPLKPKLMDHEFVYEIYIPFHEGSSSAHEKFTINDFDYGIMTASALLTFSRDGRIEGGSIAIGGGIPNLVTLDCVKGLRPEEMIDEVAELARKEVSPIEDYKASADYRRYLAGVVAARALRRAAWRYREQ